jgi:hypothetical protein
MRIIPVFGLGDQPCFITVGIAILR